MIEIIDTLTPDSILDQAKGDNLDYVLVIGKKDDGWYFASSDPDSVKAMQAAQTFLQFAMSID